MEAISLEELKSEKSPRISAEDLIELCELVGPTITRSPSKKSAKSKPKILIIDVRSREEYPFFLAELFTTAMFFNWKGARTKSHEKWDFIVISGLWLVN